MDSEDAFQEITVLFHVTAARQHTTGYDQVLARHNNFLLLICKSNAIFYAGIKTMRQTVRYENGNLIGLPEEVIERLSLKSGDELEVVVNSSDHVILGCQAQADNIRNGSF